jgi:F-type H+-transporting ATPase subunit b
VIYSSVFDDVTKAIEAGLNSALQNPSIVVLNLISFVVLVFIIRKFFWAKVTLFVEKRQQVMMEALEDAEKERKRALELQEKSAKDYEQMRIQTQELKEKLLRDAYKEQEALINKAKEDVKRRLDQAKRDIEFEIASANEEIKQSIKEIAFIAAEKIVKREIDESVHQDIIDEILGESLKQ